MQTGIDKGKSINNTNNIVFAGKGCFGSLFQVHKRTSSEADSSRKTNTYLWNIGLNMLIKYELVWWGLIGFE